MKRLLMLSVLILAAVIFPQTALADAGGWPTHTPTVTPTFTALPNPFALPTPTVLPGINIIIFTPTAPFPLNAPLPGEDEMSIPPTAVPQGAVSAEGIPLPAGNLTSTPARAGGASLGGIAFWLVPIAVLFGLIFLLNRFRSGVRRGS